MASNCVLLKRVSEIQKEPEKGEEPGRVRENWMKIEEEELRACRDKKLENMERRVRTNKREEEK